MNYERTILEMMERIKTIEERLEIWGEHNPKIENLDDRNEEGDVMTQELKKSGRILSRNEIMQILRDNYGFNVRKANRSEGSGIVISKNGKQYNIKVSFSRSYPAYANEDVICSGWHTRLEEVINNQDFPFFIFVVADAENRFHYFIFKRQDIINVFHYKVYDSHRRLHFYFRVRKNGKPFEVREIEKDMSLYYNNWTVFENVE